MKKSENLTKRYKTLQNLERKSIIQNARFGITKFQQMKLSRKTYHPYLQAPLKVANLREKTFSIRIHKQHIKNPFNQKETKQTLKYFYKNKMQKQRQESQNSQIHEKLRINRMRATHINTQANWMRDQQFKDFINKTQKLQDLLHINQRKKKPNSFAHHSKVGEVVVKKIEEDSNQQINYKANIKDIIIIGWKPQPRQGHSTIIYKQYVYLIGGHCSHPFSIIHVYSILTNSWIKQIQTNFARSYHSTVIYKERLAILFGGMGAYDPSTRSHKCFKTINIFDFETYKFKQLKMKDQQNIEGRRCHSAVLFGTQMLVLGGINTNKQYLSDFLHLDLQEQKWYQKELVINNEYLKQFMKFGIANHAAISTFKQRKSYSFYTNNYSDKEGILIFGGSNKNQEQNILIKLTFQNFLPVLKLVNFNGCPPPTEYPLLSRYNEDIIMIISGQYLQRCIFMYQIQEQTFLKVELPKNYSPGGIKSSISKELDQYYIFFGLTEKGYKGSITKIAIKQEIIQKKKNQKINLQKSQILSDSDDSQKFYNF